MGLHLGRAAVLSMAVIGLGVSGVWGANPTQLTWAPLNGSTSWDTTSLNWSNIGSRTKWVNGFTVASLTNTIAEVNGNIVANGLILSNAEVAAGTGTLEITGTSPFVQISSGLPSEIDAGIAGSNGLTFSFGSLILGGASTYAGGTVINDAQLTLNANHALPTGGDVRFSGGGSTLDMRTFNEALGNVALDGGTITIGGSSTPGGNVSMGDFSGNGTISMTGGSLNAGNMTMNGTMNVTMGTVTAVSLMMTGNVTITGPATVPQGGQVAGGLTVGNLSGSGTMDLEHATLQVGDTNSLTSYSGNFSGNGSLDKEGTSELILQGTGILPGYFSSGAYTVDGGTLFGTTNNLGNGIFVAAGATLGFSQASDGTFNGTISGGGSVLLTSHGQAVETITFSQANTYTGSTEIGTGVELSVSNDNELGTLVTDGPPGQVGLPGQPGKGPTQVTTYATLILDGGTLLATAGLTSARPVQVTAHNGELALTGGSSVFSGNVTGAGTLTIDGVGSVLFSGSTDAFFGLSIGRSQVTASGAAMALTAFNVLGGSMTLENGATLSTVTGTTLEGPMTVADAASSWTSGGNVAVTVLGGLTIVGGNVSVAGVTTVTGLSSLTVNGGRFSTGALAGGIEGRTLTMTISDGSGGAALTIGSTTAGDAGYTGMIADGSGGSGSVVKVGTNTETLSANNTYTGGTSVTGGTLILSGTTASDDFSASNGTLTLSGNALGLGFESITAGAGGTVSYENGERVTGGFLFGPGTHVLGSATLTGTQIFNGAQVNVVTGTLKAVVSAGAMTVETGGSLTWNGGTNMGSLDVGLLGTVGVSGFTSGGEITVEGLGTLNVTGNLVLSGGSRTTVVGTPPGVDKNGHPVVGFSGKIVMTGGTIQLNGGLLVNNGSITGETDVNFGSVAKGSGTYGAVVVNDGGTFSPGNSPGEAMTGDTMWSAGGNYQWQLTDATGAQGVGYDHWTVNGGLTITAGTTSNSQFVIEVGTLDGGDAPGLATDFDATRAWTWEILSASGGISGFSAGEFRVDTSGFENGTAGGAFSLVEEGNGLDLVFTPAAVPEPGTLMLAGVGMAGLLMKRRRRG